MPVFVSYVGKYVFNEKHFHMLNIERSNATPDSGDPTSIDFSVYCYDYGEGYEYEKYLKNTDVGGAGKLQIVDDQGYSHLCTYIGGALRQWRMIDIGSHYTGEMNKVVTYPIFTCTVPPDASFEANMERSFTTLTWNPGSSGGGGGKILIE